MAPRLTGVLLLVGVGHAAVDRQHHLRAGAPGDLRARSARRRARPPCRSARRGRNAACASAPRPAPIRRPSARSGRPLHVGDGLVVHRHQPGARAGLDGHVAHRHAAFHAQSADRRAAELDRVAGAAGGADAADDRQHDVLGGDAARQRPSTLTSMFFAFFASSVCVAITCSTSLVPMPCASAPKAPWVLVWLVAADHGHARQRGALLRPDDVHDALALVQEGEVRRRAEGLDVGVQRGRPAAC